jgi:hypothetical protein
VKSPTRRGPAKYYGKKTLKTDTYLADIKHFISSRFFLAGALALGFLLVLSSILMPLAPTVSALTSLDLGATYWSSGPTSMRRQIHRHFMQHGVYLPTDSVVFSSNIEVNDEQIDYLSKSSCGSFDTAVWLPISVQLPFIGVQSFEWCLTLQKPKQP